MGEKLPSTIDVDCRFSYGRHGADELRKLFNTIGIVDVFSEVSVPFNRESLLVAGEGAVLDFRGVFNSMTYMRNNILHEDATPNLTVEQVRDYVGATQRFALALDDKLKAMLPCVAQAA